MDFAYAFAIVALAILGGWFGAGLRSYTSKKGENLATKEDLHELTEIVESIKDTNARGLAELTASMSAHQSMRSAALEKRLEVHQDAYRMSMLMFQKLYAEEMDHREMVNKIREWWMKNALYLDPAPRSAFDKAWTAFAVHPALIDPRGRASAEDVMANFEIIRALGPIIEKAVALPEIVLTEQKLGANAEGVVEEGPAANP